MFVPMSTDCSLSYPSPTLAPFTDSHPSLPLLHTPSKLNPSGLRLVLLSPSPPSHSPFVSHDTKLMGFSDSYCLTDDDIKVDFLSSVITFCCMELKIYIQHIHPWIALLLDFLICYSFSLAIQFYFLVSRAVPHLPPRFTPTILDRAVKNTWVARLT